MDLRFLPSADESRDELPLPGEPLLPFVLVVVIAAEEAQAELAALFAQLSQVTDAVAYVIVAALSERGATAQMATCLPSSPLPCDVVRDGDRLHPGTIYIVPNRSSATVHDGNIRLVPMRSEDGFVRATNGLLASVARQQNCTAITVYLGTDKPAAFAASGRIREAGGFVLQALAAGQLQESDGVSKQDACDLSLPAEALPVELRRLIEGSDPLHNNRISQTSYSAVQPILTLLRTHLGYDLQGYNLDTISQRIGRRMLLRMKDISTYYSLLQSSSTELQKLGSDILMPFTRFFRDAASWEQLGKVGLPRLFERGAGGPVRIWSAGCSTGEEAYSLAMLLVEQQERTKLPLSFVIFATDIDTGSLMSARAGLYSHAIEQEISHQRLERFFRREEGGYRVLPELRDLCVFSDHNLCFEAPLAAIDLLVCRNTIRYFGRTLQEQALTNIVHALAPEGICMLGEADVTGSLDSRLMPLDAGHQLYVKAHPTMIGNKARTEQRISPEPAVDAMSAPPAWGALSMLDGPVALQRYADNLVAARFGPPGMIVDSELTVLELRGELAPFVQISAGLASRKLQQLVKPALAEKVIELVRAASRGTAPLVARCMLPPLAEGVTIEVLPLPTDGPRNHFFLVLLQLATQPYKEGDGDAAAATPGVAGGEEQTQVGRADVGTTDVRYRQEAQKHAGQEDTRTAAPRQPEGFQTDWQEPRPTDTPANSAEVASLHSTSSARAEGGAALADTKMNGLVADSGIPLLFLDTELAIVLLSPAAADILGLSAADIGRVLTSLDLGLNDSGLEEPRLREVLETLRVYEQEIEDRQQHWYRVQVRPHRLANATVGLIVMFVDIDTERTLRHQLLQARDFAACVLQQVPLPLAVLHADMTFRSANAAFQSLTGTTGQKLAGWPLGDFTQRFWGVSAAGIELHKLETLPIGGLIETEFSTRSAPGQILLLKGQALLNGSARVLLLVVEDVSLRRETDRVLARQQTALADQLENRDTLLKVTQKELHDLAQHLFTVQEQERERIASELHDDVSQRLSLLQMACSRLSQIQHAPDEMHEIQSILQQVQSLSSDVRVMSHNLHPALLKQLGLVVALKSLVDDFRDKENLPATLTSTIGAMQPSDLASTTCYRVVQEALRNVAKHAGRTHVKVSLDAVGDRLRLQIRDFGNGFDQASHFPQAGLGLTSMRERTRIAGGTFSVVSTLGEGTSIVLEVPAGVDV